MGIVSSVDHACSITPFIVKLLNCLVIRSSEHPPLVTLKFDILNCPATGTDELMSLAEKKIVKEKYYTCDMFSRFCIFYGCFMMIFS